MYNTDTIMTSLWLCLARDFRKMHGASFLKKEEALLHLGIDQLRQYEWPDRLNTSPSFFKANYQMEVLYKRYRFTTDMYSDSELKDKTFKSWLETQQSLSRPFVPSMGLQRILRRARKIIKDVLGPYDMEEHIELCGFGKRATKGSGLLKSYLDLKLTAPISSSRGLSVWFKKYLESDPLLTEVLGEIPTYDVTALDLILVPKSWKTLRPITPNTTVGTWYTSGLGEMIADRLKAIGLNIHNLQERHGRLARSSSISRRNVTADLSAASDSYVWELLQWVIPRPWLNALRRGRLSYIEYEGVTYPLRSFMAMGIGFTFSLQTLIFYALIRATKEELCLEDGTISVYGDDLIYPRSWHKYVKVVLERCFFRLNKDKTFVDSHFRESCGSDYFHGCDVRPFQPEGEGRVLSRKKTVMFVYKLVNGLFRRWSEAELPITTYYFQRLLATLDGFICQVPLFYPDTSGWKVETIRKDWFINWSPVKVVRTVDAANRPTLNYRYQFLYYKMISYDRAVLSQLPYYWQSLNPCKPLPSIWTKYSEELRWIKPRGQKRPRRGRVTRIPVVDSKSKTRILNQTGSVDNWTYGLTAV